MTPDELKTKHKAKRMAIRAEALATMHRKLALLRSQGQIRAEDEPFIKWLVDFMPYVGLNDPESVMIRRGMAKALLDKRYPYGGSTLQRFAQTICSNEQSSANAEANQNKTKQ